MKKIEIYRAEYQKTKRDYKKEKLFEMRYDLIKKNGNILT